MMLKKGKDILNKNTITVCAVKNLYLTSPSGGLELIECLLGTDENNKVYYYRLDWENKAEWMPYGTYKKDE